MEQTDDPGAQADLKGSAILAFCVHQLMQADRYDLAEPVARLLTETTPAAAEAHTLLATVLDGLGRWNDAEPHWRRASELTPESPVARFNHALSVLRLGDFSRGLTLYQSRVDKPDWTGLSSLPSRPLARDRLLQPGEAVAGRTILVLTEQGLGDCILFARYLPSLAARGARVVLACSANLACIFRGMPGIAELLAPPAEQLNAKINLAALAFDRWTPLLSLPLHVAGVSVPAPVPYLPVDPARQAMWRRRYERDGHPGRPKIGLVFAANPAAGNAALRSLRDDDLAPLLQVPGIDWIVLQHGKAGREFAERHPDAIDALTDEVDLREFAAAIAATDLLITADTMAAHLAGAIDHPGWVAIPFNPHWFWGLDSKTVGWYPALRLFRQQTKSQWSVPIQDMARLLRAFDSR